MTKLAESLIDKYLGEGLLDKFEKFVGKELKKGRMTLKGYPVDIDDSGDGSSIAMDAVDKDAATDFVKELRAAGFKASLVGSRGILVKE